MNREEIKARWDAATPGPWHVDEWERTFDVGSPTLHVAQCLRDPRGRDDAEAIAHAPTDIRALLDELEAQDRIPDGWVMAAEFPADRYFVRREGDTFVMYCEDDHGSFS